MEQKEDSELLESLLEVCASSPLPTGDVLAGTSIRVDRARGRREK